MAAATTLCSTGAAATGRGSIDTSGAGGCRCPLAPRPRPRRRFGRRTRGRRSAMGKLLSRRERRKGPETGPRTGTSRPGDADEQPASAGTRRLATAHSGLTSSVLDVAQTGPAYRTPEQGVRSGGWAGLPGVGDGSPAAVVPLLVPDAGEALGGQGRGRVDRGAGVGQGLQQERDPGWLAAAVAGGVVGLVVAGGQGAGRRVGGERGHRDPPCDSIHKPWWTTTAPAPLRQALRTYRLGLATRGSRGL